MLSKKEFLKNILLEISEVGEGANIEEYYKKIFRHILMYMKRITYLHEEGFFKGKPYIDIEDFKEVFEIE